MHRIESPMTSLKNNFIIENDVILYWGQNFSANDVSYDDVINAEPKTENLCHSLDQMQNLNSLPLLVSE